MKLLILSIQTLLKPWYKTLNYITLEGDKSTNACISTDDAQSPQISSKSKTRDFANDDGLRGRSIAARVKPFSVQDTLPIRLIGCRDKGTYITSNKFDLIVYESYFGLIEIFEPAPEDLFRKRIFYIFLNRPSHGSCTV